MFKFREDHPLRPPAWRWERARVLKEYGKATPGKYKDDKWIRAAAQFRKLKDDCPDEIALYELFDRYPQIAMAYELWDEESAAALGSRANATRYEIEARILARESWPTISKRSGLSTDVLQWYEKLFFNVLDRIDNRMYIFHQAIGDVLQRGMTDRDYAVLWKMYGYVRGPAMLDYLITTFSDWSRPKRDQVETRLLDDHKSVMRRKAALASRMVGINHHSSDRLIELHTKIVEVEKSAGEGGTDSIHNNIQVMLNSLPLLVGVQAGGAAGSAMAQYYGMSGDLRASEMLALSAGENIDMSDINYKLPEPLNHGQETN